MNTIDQRDVEAIFKILLFLILVLLRWILMMNQEEE